MRSSKNQIVRKEYLSSSLLSGGEVVIFLFNISKFVSLQKKLNHRSKWCILQMAKVSEVRRMACCDVSRGALLHSSVSQRHIMPFPYLGGISRQPRLSFSVIRVAMARLKQPLWTSLEAGSPENKLKVVHQGNRYTGEGDGTTLL